MKIKKKTLVLWKKRLTVFFSITFVCGVLYVYFFTDTLLVTSFSFSGVQEKDMQVLDAKLHDALGKDTFFILPGNKVLTFNTKNLKEVVLELLPNTKQVTIHPTGFHTLYVSVVSYVPMFQAGGGRAIDENGILYTEQNDIHALPTITFASTTPTADFLQALAQFIPKINTLLFPITRVAVDGYGDAYLYSGISSGKVILAKTTDFNKAWLALISAVDTDPLKVSLGDKKRSLDYVDLRFGNKVFYKFTNEGVPDIILKHATTTSATSTLR